MEYRYQPLELPTDSSFWVRIATLQPGSNEIEVSISTLSIDKNSPRRYDFQALSYTWGDSTDSVCIKIRNDDGGMASMPVGKSLHDALVHLRAAKPRKWWIDAICINESPRTQAEKAEKDWSVKQMHLIYGCATSVLVWLGPASACSSLAMRTMQEIGHGISYDESSYELKSTPDWDRINELLSEEAYHSIDSILSRPWFDRVWIRQEAFAAMAQGAIQCGKDVVSVKDFTTACFIMNRLPDTDYTANRSKITVRIVEVLGIFQHAFKTIASMMFQNRTSKCRFLHDKIYGCLGMMSVCGQTQFVSGIKVEYDRPVQDVYRDFFLYYLQEKHSLTMLNYSGLCQKSPLGMASWIPDWSVSFHSLDLSFQAACSHAKYAEAAYVDKDTLQVNGVLCSAVQKVVPFHATMLIDQTLDETCEAICTKFELDHKTSDATITSIGYAFCSMFNNLSSSLNEIEEQRQDFLNYFRSFAQRRKRLENLFLSSEITLRNEGTSTSARKAFRSFGSSSWPWIILEGGKYGIGCAEVRAGDVVAVVIGITNLVILRPLDNHTYQLVGSAFVHGLNDGQALLGPLPAGVKVIPRLVPAWGAYVPYYVNIKNESASFWDPRIEWSELDASTAEAGLPTINAPPDEPDRLMPTAAYLKRSGADVRQLKLT